jgi:hypothetical protein
MVTYGINEALIQMLAKEIGNKELQLLIALYFKTSALTPETHEWVRRTRPLQWNKSTMPFILTFSLS